MRLALCFGYLALFACCCGAPEKNATVQHAGAAAAGGTSAGAFADRQQQDLLKWALGHADPDALRQQAQQAQAAKQASARDMAERQTRVQQLIKAVSSAPTEAQLMKQAGSILANVSMPEDRMLAAVEVMTYLVRSACWMKHQLLPICCCSLLPASPSSSAHLPTPSSLLIVSMHRWRTWTTQIRCTS